VLEKYKNYFLLHLTVFIYGFTGILGKLISLPADNLVWFRLVIAIVALAIFFIASNKSFAANYKDIFKYAGVGFIIALHWVFFYRSIKVGSVSVAVVCLSASTFFTALVEPLFFKRRLRVYELLGGLFIFLALFFMFSDDKVSTAGVWEGLISAFLAAVFPVMNGVLTNKNNPFSITFYELLGGLFFLSLFFLFTGEFTNNFWAVSTMDWMWLLLLGIVCTAFTFVVGVKIMREISPFTVVLSINLEPVYTIMLAYFIFADAERMSMRFYAGTVIILMCIGINAYLKKRFGKMK
jgi:drug/metabolite transporter (DMT)-like permease